LNYFVQPAASEFIVRGFAGGLFSRMGHNPVLGIRDFAGEACFEPEAVTSSSLHLTINASSLEVQNDAVEKDRREMKRMMDGEVLEALQYPEITFQSAGVSGARLDDSAWRLLIDGYLTLHGITRGLQVPSRLSVANGRLRAVGEFSIYQTDYGIKLVSVAGGTLKLKDELKLSYDIVAAATTEDRKTLCA